MTKLDTRHAAGHGQVRKIAIGTSCLAVLLLGACEKAAPQLHAAPPVVEVITVAQRDVPIHMEFVASVSGSVNAVIRPQVTGYLIKQNYEEGQLVKKGQPLFEIDPRTFEAAVEQAKGVRAQAQARYDTSRANLTRIKPLAEKNAVSQKDLDDSVGANLTAKATLDSAEAALQTATLNLGFTRITSPITGIAGKAKAQIGDLLSPSMTTELTTVSTIDPITVYFNVSEREYLKLHTARSVSEARKLPFDLILIDGSVFPYPGTFKFIDRQVDATTGTFLAAAEYPNPEMLLRPGQFGKIRVTTSVHKDALLVPQRAVTEIQGKYLIAVVGADNKVDIRPVTVGDRVGSEWIINTGIKPGESVLVEGTQKVRPGAAVNPKPFVPSTPPVAPGKAEEKPAATAAKG